MPKEAPRFAYGDGSTPVSLEAARTWWEGILERGEIEEPRAIAFDLTCHSREQARHLAAYIAERRDYTVRVAQATHPGYEGKWQVQGLVPAQRLSFDSIRTLFEWLGTIEVLHDAYVTFVRTTEGAA